MGVNKYRKKPIVIEALLWDGNNWHQVIKFVGNDNIEPEKVPIDKPTWRLVIPTLEGDMLCDVGDYIIKGVKGEFYPCKPDIFEATYELVKQLTDSKKG